ncbi:cell cycle checkpoint control protein RAD9B [Pantherophis guttatus]|uniref:Cell cycle checkpoint control protein RAD9A n=1 Tax=Pantherophis guttatus TaxID=94885 RepID=A0A6P9CZ31_PANGU|nr:cell cycle checkpoint control protein RAD9B [Pantherophis guttatus]
MMKCVIGGARVRVFGRALHAIARISDEFWIDPKEKGLFLRTVNSSRSAYACVFFSSTFFQNYSYGNATERSLNGDTVQFACKLIIKAILPLFRCLHTLERNVEKCNIYTDVNDCHIVFKLFCKHGIVKTHSLAFQECEPLQAVFAKDLCTNVLKVHSRQLSDMLIHFPTYQEEITLGVTPMKVCFKTYTEDEMEFAKTAHTEIHLSPDEFEYFQVGVDSEVTFCLKELRGLLVFAEALSVPVSVHFDVSGKPVAFSIEDPVIEALFVLATLSDTESCTTASKPACLEQSQNRGPARERSNQHITSCRRKASIAPSEGFSTGEEPPHPNYNKFHSLFFGAVSPNEQSDANLLHNLATVSDTEEDCAHGQLSPTF